MLHYHPMISSRHFLLSIAQIYRRIQSHYVRCPMSNVRIHYNRFIIPSISLILHILFHSYVLAAKGIFIFRYAIGSWERPQLHAPIGWLDALANDVQATYDNSTGPSMKYKFIIH